MENETVVKPKKQPKKIKGVFWKRGAWWARIFHDGKEICRRCDSQAQAAAVYGGLLKQRRENKLFDKARKLEPLPFKMVAAEYEQEKGVDKRRPKDDRARIRFWVERFGEKDVAAITSDDIRKGLAALREPMAQRHGRIEKGGRRSIATIRRYVVVLHAVLERARKTLREANVDMLNRAADIELKKADNTLVRFLTMEQEAALLHELPEAFRPITRLAIHTGLRQGELLRLTWGDVDEASGTLQIRETKNDTPRRAWMNSMVQEVLSGLKGTGKPEATARLFPFNKRYLGRVFKRAVEAAKVAPFRFHDLRHTFASRLAMNGANDRTIMALGGWKSPRMLDRYAHLSPAHCWQAVEGLTKFGAKFGTVPVEVS